MLALRVLRNEPLHGYAIAQRIRELSDSVLQAEEGSLYPTLQKMLLEGWVKAEWGILGHRPPRPLLLAHQSRRKAPEAGARRIHDR